MLGRPARAPPISTALKCPSPPRPSVRKIQERGQRHRQLSGMPFATGFVPPCIPTRTVRPPAGPDWVHEIKHDGTATKGRRSKNAAMRNRSICLGLLSYIIRFIQNAINLRSA
jgi:hypothetical protein